jgi:hypothetical protein
MAANFAHMSAHRATPKKLAIAERRLRVARAYCQGKGIVAIVAAEGVNHGTVSRDLAAVRDEWQNARHGLLDERVAVELAKIDNLEAVAWEAWFRSCEDSQTQKTRKVKGKTAFEVVEVSEEKVKTKERRPVQLPDIDTAEMIRRGQSGNPAFLERVSWCINRRCELLGLDTAKRIVLPQAGEGSDELSDEERQAAFLRIVTEMGAGCAGEDGGAEAGEAGSAVLGGPGPADGGCGQAAGPLAGEAAAGELDEGPSPLFPAVQ